MRVVFDIFDIIYRDLGGGCQTYIFAGVAFWNIVTAVIRICFSFFREKAH